MVVGKIRSNEKVSNLIGNRNCDLPACSIVPQSTTLLRAPNLLLKDTDNRQGGVRMPRRKKRM
jgi:hypothetical protein